MFVGFQGFSQNNFPWAKLAPGNGIDEGIAITNDPAGNVFVTGQFTGSVVAFGTTTLTNSANSTVFLAKYDCNGNAIWAKKAICTNNDYGNAVTTDAAGNIFISGYFQSPTIVFGTYSLSNGGNYDLFIAKYDPNGNVLWAKSAGGSGNEYGYSAKTDPGGNVYVTGSFSSPTLALGTYSLTNSGASDGYLVKYSPSGTELWANKQAGSTGDENWSVATDAAGNVFITGDYVSPTVAFDTYTITNSGICPIYTAKYDGNGNIMWVETTGGTNYDFSNWVTIDNNGDVLISGVFTSTNMVFGTNTITNNGGEDAFIAKYSNSGTPIWAKAVGGPGNDKGYSIATDANKIYCTGTFTNSIYFGTSTLTAAVNSPDPFYIITFDYSGLVQCSTYLKSGGDDLVGICADNAGSAYLTADIMAPGSMVVGNTTLTPTGGETIYLARYVCGDITGINENADELKVDLFPNPNNGNFKIEINKPLKNSELSVVNSIGQEVHKQAVTKGENTIVIKNLPKGIYHYIILENQQQVLKGQLLIE